MINMEIGSELYSRFIEIYMESYNNIDHILSQPNIAPYLDVKNNSYLSKLLNEYPECDIRVLQAFCFSIYCVLIYTNF